MDFHALDLIMYLVICAIIWIVFMPGDFKEEIGLLAGIPIMIGFSTLYLIVFALWPNWNWIDIFHSWGLYFKSINFTM
jgi:hypothetical protein